MGTCFPIQDVVWVAAGSSVGTHNDSKSKIARLLKVLSFETEILKPSNFSNSVSQSKCTHFWIKMSRSIFVSHKMTVESVRLVEKAITVRASKTQGKNIYIICMNDQIVESQ